MSAEPSKIPNLNVVMVVTAPRPRFLHLAGVPHIHFVPYDRLDSIAILSQNPLAIFYHSFQDGEVEGDEVQEALQPETNEDDVWLWSRFCGAVWDSLGKSAARDIVSFRRTCEKLWTPFVKPIRDNILGTRDFSKLMVRNRGLFQGEAALIETVVSTAFDAKKTSRRKNSISNFQSGAILLTMNRLLSIPVLHQFSSDCRISSLL